jgi:hypothetical protein
MYWSSLQILLFPLPILIPPTDPRSFTIGSSDATKSPGRYLEESSCSETTLRIPQTRCGLSLWLCFDSCSQFLNSRLNCERSGCSHKAQTLARKLGWREYLQAAFSPIVCEGNGLCLIKCLSFRVRPAAILRSLIRDGAVSHYGLR